VAPGAPRPTDPPVDWLLIGEITGVFGLKGEVKVRPETDFPERFTHTPTVYLAPDYAPWPVAGARVAPGGQVILHLRDLHDATAAGKVRGRRIYVPASEATALPPDRYYLHDLIGLRAQRRDGTPLGTLIDVYSGSGNDVYAIREAVTGREVLVPAVKEMIVRVDVAGGIMVIAPIPGLFDDDAEVAE
jgi:16S rRNA processing protein RimM